MVYQSSPNRVQDCLACQIFRDMDRTRTIDLLTVTHFFCLHSLFAFLLLSVSLSIYLSIYLSTCLYIFMILSLITFPHFLSLLSSTSSILSTLYSPYLSLYLSVHTAVSSVHALVTPLLSALRDSGSTSHTIAATDSMGGKGALIGRIGEKK